MLCSLRQMTSNQPVPFAFVYILSFPTSLLFYPQGGLLPSPSLLLLGLWSNASLVWFHKNRILLVLFIYLVFFFFSVNVGPKMYLHCERDCRVGEGLGAWVRIRAVFSHQIQTLILQSRKGTPTDTPQQPLSCRNLHEVILPSNRVCCSVAKFPIPSSGMLQTNSNYFLLRAIVKHYKLADSKIINTGVVTLHYNQNFNLNFHL